MPRLPKIHVKLRKDPHERLVASISDAAVAVHLELGAGLPDALYSTCLLHELAQRGLAARATVSFPIHYKELVIEDAFQVDLVVEDRVLVELRSEGELERFEGERMSTFLRHSGKRVGLLVNFGVHHLGEWIKRVDA